MRAITGLSLLFSISLILGCGGGAGDELDRVVVRGTVTYQGEPIENGQIRFVPAEDTKGPVSGASIQDGKYVADGNGGVVVGSHEVRIEGFRAAETSPDSNSDEFNEGPPREQYLPAKYNARTELTATVDESNTEIDFELE